MLLSNIRGIIKERGFGVKIAQKQAIAFMLAEMRTEIEAIRLLTWEAAWKMDTARRMPDRSLFAAQAQRHGDDGDHRASKSWRHGYIQSTQSKCG
jgi:alkylation response protein AidB-like acyl-CoA dehydrogenase